MSMASVKVGVGLLLGIAVACQSESPDPLLPEIPTGKPLLSDLRVPEPLFADDGWAVMAWANRQDPSGLVAAAEMHLTSDRGESERLVLSPMFCRDERGSVYRCREFSVLLRDGVDLSRVVPPVIDLPGAITFFNPAGNHITVHVLEGDLETAMKRASRWSEARVVERLGLICLNHCPSWADEGPAGPIADGPLQGGLLLKVHAAPPEPSDGVVQVLRGDGVRVEYDQPDGSVLSAHTIVTDEWCVIRNGLGECALQHRGSQWYARGEYVYEPGGCTFLPPDNAGAFPFDCGTILIGLNEGTTAGAVDDLLLRINGFLESDRSGGKYGFIVVGVSVGSEREAILEAFRDPRTRYAALNFTGPAEAY